MLNQVLISLITFLLTVILGLVSLAYRDVRNRLKAIEMRQSNTIRVMFLLMSRLHPDKSHIVTETMKDILVNGKSNGAYEASA